MLVVGKVSCLFCFSMFILSCMLVSEKWIGLNVLVGFLWEGMGLVVVVVGLFFVWIIIVFGRLWLRWVRMLKLVVVFVGSLCIMRLCSVFFGSRLENYGWRLWLVCVSGLEVSV